MASTAHTIIEGTVERTNRDGVKLIGRSDWINLSQHGPAAAKGLPPAGASVVLDCTPTANGKLWIGDWEPIGTEALPPAPATSQPVARTPAASDAGQPAASAPAIAEPAQPKPTPLGAGMREFPRAVPAANDRELLTARMSALKSANRLAAAYVSTRPVTPGQVLELADTFLEWLLA